VVPPLYRWHMEDLSEQQARDFLAAAEVGHLAVIDRGKPYVTPMSFVLNDNTILLRTGFGRRLEAIRANWYFLEREMIDQRFALREQLTREEWGQIFPVR